MWEREPTVLAGDGISKMILRGWGGVGGRLNLCIDPLYPEATLLQ